MGNKKNLPNIPIYIGDWERDCNVLSLESEAAWMRIVFKLWTKGKQNSIKIPTKSLQNLWRCSEEKMKEILDDLIFNEIAEIATGTDFVEFSCRRFVRENKISKIRSEASKGNKNADKMKSKPKQKGNKKTQNTENEIDYVNEIEVKDEIVIKEKSEKIIFPFSSKEFMAQWQIWKQFKKKEFGFNYKSTLSEQGALKKLSELSDGDEKTAIAIIHQSISEGWKGLFNLKNNGKQITGKQGASADFRRKTAERLGIVRPD